jgi:hypothetical protein
MIPGHVPAKNALARYPAGLLHEAAVDAEAARIIEAPSGNPGSVKFGFENVYQHGLINVTRGQRGSTLVF